MGAEGAAESAGAPWAADAAEARRHLEALARLPLPAGGLKILNVCGGHERTLAQAGLRAALPPGLEAVPGPGCPVCVCPEEDLRLAARIALAGEAVLACFGDMLRVPFSPGSRRGLPRSLEEARARGGRVLPVASPREAWRAAEELAPTPVVLFAVGFETTMAPVAALLASRPPPNLLVLCAGRRTWPVVAHLLRQGPPAFQAPPAMHAPRSVDAIVAPGHVATVAGPEEWAFVPERHGLPAVVAPFTAGGLARALRRAAELAVAGEARLENAYPAAVRPGGNPTARALLAEVFEVVEAPWRGIGRLPASGYALRGEHAARDARRRFAHLGGPGVEEAAGEREGGGMPGACACAEVVLGRRYPDQCPLYGRPCTPARPVGPCMVSAEGACRIWWAAGRRPGRAVP